jgi:dUTP pyrophosphatase
MFRVRMTSSLLIKYLPDTDQDFPLPKYQTMGSSGLDLRAYLPKDKRVDGINLFPGEQSLVSTGFAIQVPDGFEGQIRARSGLSLKYGVNLANGVGTIDSDYTGELGILLFNAGSKRFVIEHSARIAQLVIAPYELVTLQIVDSIPETRRNNSGFGSTGNF